MMKANRGLEGVARSVRFLVIVALVLMLLAFVSFAIALFIASEWFISLPLWTKWLICALLVIWFRADQIIAFFKKAWARVFDHSPTGEEMAR